MRAGNRAERRATFYGEVLAPDVFHGILLERLGRITSLLRTVVNQTVLADVEVTGACAAAPLVGATVRDVVLEEVELCVASLRHALHAEVDFALFRF